MQNTFVNKLLNAKLPCFFGKKLYSVEKYQDCFFVFNFENTCEMLFFSLKKPFIFLDIISKNDLSFFPKFEQSSILKKAQNQAFKGFEYDDIKKQIFIIFEPCVITIEFEDHGKVFLEQKKIPHSHQINKEVFNLEEMQYLKHVKDQLYLYFSKRSRSYEKKIKNTLSKLVLELYSLDEKIEFLNTKLQFIFENQQFWEMKDQDLQENKNKFGISRQQTVGEALNKSYKELKKLNRSKVKLPLVIQEYEKKLDTPQSSKFIVKKVNSEKKEKAFCRIFYTSLNETIWVGRNAKENDAITFKFSNGNDFWFHIQDYPGAHVVIHHPSPSEEAIKKARLLAKYFSKAKDEENSRTAD